MAFNSSDIVLERGDHVLADRTGASGWHSSKKTGFGLGAGDRSFTFHHILPYRYPQLVGYILCAFARTYGAGSEWSRTLYAQRDKLLREANIRPEEFPTMFAWMPAVLFLGPNGALRLDDPGSDRELQKPDRMSAKQWDALHALGDFLDTKVLKSKAVTKQAGGGTVVSLQRVTGREFYALMRHLDKIASTSGKMYHLFRPEEWVIVESSDPAFTLTKMPSPAERDKFKVHVASRPSLITISQMGKYRAVSGPGVAPLTFKYLRLKTPEDRPTATMDANFAVGDAVG